MVVFPLLNHVHFALHPPDAVIGRCPTGNDRGDNHARRAETGDPQADLSVSPEAVHRWDDN